MQQSQGRSYCWVFLLALLGGVPMAQAASGPVAQGSPFRIDDGAYPYITDASVARASDGSLVVVYQPQDNTGLPPLLARRLDALGNPLGPAAPVTSDGSQEVYSARVAVNAAGNFAVVWGTINDALYVRAFASDGTPLGPQFRVDDSANPLLVQAELVSNQPPPYAVAIDGQNRILLAWTTANGTRAQYQVGKPGKVVARRFTAAGAAVDAAPFTVNSGTLLPVHSALALAMAPGSQFVVAWISNLSYSIPTGLGQQMLNLSTAEVLFQRYSAAAVAQGQPGSTGLQVGRVDVGQTAYLDAAINESGQFALSWDGFAAFDTVYAQRFTAAGLPASGRLGYPFQNTATTPTRTAVGIDKVGDCVAAWDDLDHVSPAPLLDLLNGIIPAGEFSGLAYGIALRYTQDLVMGADGSFVMIYFSYSAGGASTSLLGQRYTLQ